MRVLDFKRQRVPHSIASQSDRPRPIEEIISIATSHTTVGRSSVHPQRGLEIYMESWRSDCGSERGFRRDVARLRLRRGVFSLCLLLLSNLTFALNHSMLPLMREFGLQGMVQDSYDNNRISSPSAPAPYARADGFSGVGAQDRLQMSHLPIVLRRRLQTHGRRNVLAESPIPTCTFLTCFASPLHGGTSIGRGVSGCCGGRRFMSIKLPF